ncbi:MAG: polysaccharide biosynthesis tyrosine autokinase [Propionibacteriales bacterium]|nr:polysaccharide biosynthesis tyrosine autokinase [Propionibacteriales bacterium]
MELQDYLRALRTHWLGVVAIIVLVGLGAMAYTVTQEKVYAANATGFVGTGATENPALGSVNDQLAKSRATSYVDIATSRATAQQVINDLGLQTSPASLVGRVAVEQLVDTVLIKITVKAGTPEDALQLADAWVAALADQVALIESPDGPPADGTPRVVPVESAALPTSPVSPNPSRNGIIALALGLLLGVAYAVVRQQLDRRLRGNDNIERRTGQSVVGTIPAAMILEHERGLAGGLAVRGARTVTSPAAEAFRKLRTNLTYMRVDDPVRSIVVTSARPGDGKSTVAANLAAALDSSGAAVVLVDGDLRRPSAAAAFGLDSTGAGLTSVLAGLVPLEEAMQRPEGYRNLRILPAGPPAPIPSELLGSHAMRTLLQQLRGEGYVIVDAPPLLPVTDAAVLSVAVDGALLVISDGRTLDTDVQQCIDSIHAVNSEVLGLVVNRTTRRRGIYGYGYDDYVDSAADNRRELQPIEERDASERAAAAEKAARSAAKVAKSRVKTKTESGPSRRASSRRRSRQDRSSSSS